MMCSGVMFLNKLMWNVLLVLFVMVMFRFVVLIGLDNVIVVIVSVILCIDVCCNFDVDYMIRGCRWFVMDDCINVFYIFNYMVIDCVLVV